MVVSRARCQGAKRLWTRSFISLQLLFLTTISDWFFRSTKFCL